MPFEQVDTVKASMDDAIRSMLDTLSAELEAQIAEKQYGMYAINSTLQFL